MSLRRTKIVCTIGPAVASPGKLQALLRAGMNVARFNFSHGDHATHRSMMQLVREASLATGIPCALLADTKGPEIRTGTVKNGDEIHLLSGNEITLTTDDVEGTVELLTISYKKLPREVVPGTRLLIADGLVDLEVIWAKDELIHCRILSEGIIGSRKNVNVLGVKTSLPAVTDKDREDLRLVMAEGVDFVAASFVRRPADIQEIQNALKAFKTEGVALPEIIAKIEDEEGLGNVSEIIRVSDGIMVARGDLGVQLPPEEIPLAQKRIIRMCNQANKVVIVATQMLDSMIRNPLPTRAEIADVANAMLDGADAVMLSGETAQGKYPVEAVAMMHRVAFQTENSEYRHDSTTTLFQKKGVSMADTVARAVVLTAEDMSADAIVAPTLSGTTPRLLSKYRPQQPIVAVTPNDNVRRKLLLSWGVYPVISNKVTEADDMIAYAIKKAMSVGLLKAYDKIILAAGIPVGSPLMLNAIRVQILADVVARGQRGFGNRAQGTVIKGRTAEEASARLNPSESQILVVQYLDESFVPLLNKIRGYVVEHFSSIPLEQKLAENPELVAVGGIPGVYAKLCDGESVTLDGAEKLILRTPEAQ